jgi:hypothetical protein
LPRRLATSRKKDDRTITNQIGHHRKKHKTNDDDTEGETNDADDAGPRPPRSHEPPTLHHTRHQKQLYLGKYAKIKSETQRLVGPFCPDSTHRVQIFPNRLIDPQKNGLICLKQSATPQLAPTNRNHPRRVSIAVAPPTRSDPPLRRRGPAGRHRTGLCRRGGVSASSLGGLLVFPIPPRSNTIVTLNLIVVLW